MLPPGLVAQNATGQFGGMGGMGGGMGGVGGKSIHRTSDAKGIADFGAVPPGDYSFQISKSWGDGLSKTGGQFNVGPGSKIQKAIVCPKTPPERTRAVRMRWSWPADLEKEQLALYAPFAYRSRKLDSSLEWVISDTTSSARQRRRSNQGMMNQAWSFPAVRFVLCGPGTTVTEILKPGSFLFWAFGQVNENGLIMRTAKPPAWADILVENLQRPTETPEPNEQTWELGTYGLDHLIVLRPSRSPRAQTGQRRFDILTGIFANGPGPTVQLRGEGNASVMTGQGALVDRGGPPTPKDLGPRTVGFAGQGFGGGMGMETGGWAEWRDVVPSVELAPEFWDNVDTAFEAHPGQVNEWTIPLPDALITAVRAALKVDPAAKPKPAGTAAATDGN